MALIDCPECQQKVSDRVKSCPHCGYPFDEGEAKDPQKVEVTSVRFRIEEGRKKRIKKIILAGFIFIIVIVTTIIAYNNVTSMQAVQAYNENVQNIMIEMIASAEEAESVMDLTYRVWYNAIYQEEDTETDQFTRREGVWVDDFNEALINLFQDVSFLYDIRTIESSQKRVAELMRQLQNPPTKFERSYETLLELYSAYQGLTELAVNPKGSLNSFSASKTEKTDKFLEHYRRFEAQLPE